MSVRVCMHVRALGIGGWRGAVVSLAERADNYMELLDRASPRTIT